MFGREPRPRTILQINVRFAYAAFILFYGWVCWQWTSPEWWGLGIIAGLCFFGGGLEIIAIVARIVAIFARERKLDDFARQGGAARGDKMVSPEALKKRGLIR